MPLRAFSADTIEKALRQVREGALSCDRPVEQFGGPGEEVPCDVCGRPIKRDEMEIEAVYSELGLRRFHVPCMNALVAACESLHRTSPLKESP